MPFSVLLFKRLKFAHVNCVPLAEMIISDKPCIANVLVITFKIFEAVMVLSTLTLTHNES